MHHTSTLAWAAVAAAVLGVNGTATGSEAPEVKMAAGTIKGGICSNSKVKHFQGIPFAQPPVGKLRFMPPQPLEGQYPGGVLDATKTPPPCIQFSDDFAVNHPTPSEDCLYLDVYVPPTAHEHSRLPVKVYAYGGGDTGGALSWPLYDACNLATDTIVVTFNYRLGPLGFLPLESAGIKGNAAIQDYIMALRWVKTNIAKFGGVPDRVMLFGQSSGADNSFVLSTLPEAKELISSVAFQSGGGQDVTSYDVAQKSGAAYAEYLKCSTTDLECLQNIPVKKLQDAFQETPYLQGTTNDQLLAPYNAAWPDKPGIAASSIDNDLIKQQPLLVGPQLPFISGYTRNDSNLFVIPEFYRYQLEGGKVTESNYTNFLLAWGEEPAKLLNQTYPLSKYLSQHDTITSVAVVAGVADMVTAANFKCPSYKMHRAAHAAGVRSYAYQFDKQPTCPWIYEEGIGAVPPVGSGSYYGAAHCADIPFVFGNMDAQPFGVGNCSASAAERRMSKTMVAAWTEMASNTSPSTTRLTWPRFGRELKGVFFDDEVTVASIDFEECTVWDEVFGMLGGVILPEAK